MAGETRCEIDLGPERCPDSSEAWQHAGVKPAAKKKKPKKPGSRPDLGAPIDDFFAKQPPLLREILDVLREMVDEAAPDAESSLKWGMPFYTVGGAMMCALGGHKSHVNLILSGPPGAFADPKGR